MKRFFCTICQQVKRVRSLPHKIENVSLLDPSKRLGKCEFHNYDGRNQYLNLKNPRSINKFTKSKPVVIDTPKRNRRSA